MFQLAIPLFVLMSGAALLGFVVAWTWRNLVVQTLQSELVQVKSINEQVESERQKLVEHANVLQFEKEQLLASQAVLNDEKAGLKEQMQLKNKWEEKYRNLHFKLLKVARERDELKKGLVPVETSLELANDQGGKSLNKIKRKFNERQDRSYATKSAPKVGFISSDYGEIAQNPKADMEEIVDDLQIISGIGPTIEEKLNALGVYRYEQISRLEEKDILLINKILDFDADYVLKNEWVAEARKLK